MPRPRSAFLSAATTSFRATSFLPFAFPFMPSRAATLVAPPLIARPAPRVAPSMVRWPGTKEPDWGSPFAKGYFDQYTPVKDYPGTFPPGASPDNHPVENFMKAPEDMVFQELDIDARCEEIIEPDEDLLEYLAKIGRLIPRSADDDEFEDESEKLMSGITEEDLEFGDEESDMLAYYSRKESGTYSAQDPYSLDHGNLVEMGGDDGMEF